MLHDIQFFDVGDFPACFFPSKLPVLPGITALLAALRGIGPTLGMAMSWGLRGEVDSKKLGSKCCIERFQKIQAYWRLAAGSSVVPQENQHLRWIWGLRGRGFSCTSPKFASGFLRASHPGTVASRVCLWGSEDWMQLPKGGLAKAAFTNIFITYTRTYVYIYIIYYHTSYVVLIYHMWYVMYPTYIHV